VVPYVQALRRECWTFKGHARDEPSHQGDAHGEKNVNGRVAPFGLRATPPGDLSHDESVDVGPVEMSYLEPMLLPGRWIEAQRKVGEWRAKTPRGSSGMYLPRNKASAHNE